MNDLGLAVGGAARTEWGDPVTLLSPSDLLLRPPRAEPTGSQGLPDPEHALAGGSRGVQPPGSVEMETYWVESTMGC